jgi:uncharacterized lipoprotein YddW (UPF0748 family)
MKLGILIIFQFIFFIALGQQRFKGVWIANVASQALQSKTSIDSAVALCQRKGITDIFMVVWNRGFTLYQSKLMKKTFGYAIDTTYGNRDPLQEMIIAAHAKGIKLHAWFEFGFSCDYQGQGKHIPEKKPTWLAKNNEGKDVVKNGFRWLNAFDPKVQNFMLNLIKEVVKNYDVDGIQGDDRLPAVPSESGYDSYTTTCYKKAHKGLAPPKNNKDSSWVAWRVNLLNQYAKKIYTTCKKLKPKLIVSMAPSIHPWSVQEYLQDWPTWLLNGYVDYVIPQFYRYQIDGYKKLVLETYGKYEKQWQQKIYVGVLASLGDGYMIKKEDLKEMLLFNQQQGVPGECFFYFGNMEKYLEDIN